jgi:hypothetical protein
MKDLFDLCKSQNWLPIVCFGTQEETPHGWLGRPISEDKWDWLTEFVRQLGIYLRDVYKFARVDFEWYNEPTKLQDLGFGWDKYCKLGTKLAKAWHSVSKNYKFYAFSDDLINLYYLQNILTDSTFMQNVDVISTHIGVAREDDEWDSYLINSANSMIAQYPHLVQSVSELTCNGIIDRLNQLPGNVIGYGHIGLLRHLINGELLGTRMDDYAVWDDNLFQITAPDKISISAQFNRDNYIPYKITEEDMVLEKEYKYGSKGIGVRFIQKVLNKDLEANLAIDGIWGNQTNIAVKSFESKYQMTIDSKVDTQQFKFMIRSYPDEWNDTEHDWSIGVR